MWYGGIICRGRIKGDFLFLPDNEQVVLTKNARRTARERNCGQRYSVCWLCAFPHIISCELAEHLQDEHFALPASLSREQAKLWTPPQA